LEAYGVTRFTKDVDFLIASSDIAIMSQLLIRAGYEKGVETSIFSRWKHPSMAVDDIDVMYVKPETFEKLLQDCRFLKVGNADLRVPSIPSLISLKLHAMKSNPDRIDKDGRDIADLLKTNPGVLNRSELEALFAKYSCSFYFPQFSHLVS